MRFSLVLQCAILTTLCSSLPSSQASEADRWPAPEIKVRQGQAFRLEATGGQEEEEGGDSKGEERGEGLHRDGCKRREC